MGGNRCSRVTGARLEPGPQETALNSAIPGKRGWQPMAPSPFRPTMQGLPITRCLRGDPISAQARIKKEKEPEAVVLVPSPLAFMRVV